MQASEREFVVQRMRENRARVLQVVEGLSPEQQNFCAEGQWSVADCVEHITLVESFVFQQMQQVLQGPPEPEKRPLAEGKLRIMQRHIPARGTKVQAPERVRPKRQWSDFRELVEAFEKTRERSMQFALETEAELHDHFFEHMIFKDLDCYQWLVFMPLHCERHLRQAEEVMAHPEFPRKAAAGA